MTVTVAETQATSARRLSGFREPAVRGLQLLVLSGFALAQPLFDILGKNAEFFAVRGSTPSDIVLFALAVTFVPALALLAVELVVGLVDARAAAVLHLVFAGFLVAVFAVQAFQRLGLEGTVPLIVASALAGVAGAVALWRVSAVRTFVTVLAPAPIVFLVLFLFSSNVEALVFPEDVEVQTAAVQAETPVVVVVFDELPVISLLKRNGEIDARGSPTSRASRALDLVQERVVPVGVDHRGSPVAALREEPAAPQAAGLPAAPRQPLHAPRRRLPDARAGVADAALPTPALPEPAPAGRGGAALVLWSDARVVYLHLVSPPALEDRLPAIDESWGNFGDEAAEAEGPPCRRS